MNSPQHVAIMMDGNRRWARRQGLPVEVGHWKGAEVILPLLPTAKELGIRWLTLYAFSTENWMRSQKEVNALMHILKNYLDTKEEALIRQGVKLETIGYLARLPQEIQEALKRVKQRTADNQSLTLILALNYGGKDEICRAVKKIFAMGIQQEEITEALIARFLDTAPFPNPDLLIRTSGESRISNFLLWQIAYTEFVFTDTLWPDFSGKDLQKAVKAYQHRHPRLGG